MLRLLSELWMTSGENLTHPWDANSYLLKGDVPTLIDCGSVEGYPALKRHLRAFGYEPSDIKQVIATHGHWDHLSGLAQLREESDVKLYIHAADREQVETGDPDRTAAFLYGRQFPPLRVDGELYDGQVLDINGYQLHVHHTPGHSPGSVCFWAEISGMRLLIAGDTIAGGYHSKLDSDLVAWEKSLDKLLTLEFDVMTIGHSPARLIFDAKHRVKVLRNRFGDLFNPWFELANVG